MSKVIKNRIKTETSGDLTNMEPKLDRNQPMNRSTKKYMKYAKLSTHTHKHINVIANHYTPNIQSLLMYITCKY